MKPRGIARYFLDAFAPMPRDEWLQCRRQKVTASEVAALIGYNHFDTAFDIFEQKVYNKQKPQTLSMQRGNYMEPLIAKGYAEMTGAVMIAPHETIDGVRWERLFEHPEDPLRAATPDYFAVTDDTFKYVECKDVSTFGQLRWIDGIPEGYHIQIQYNLNIINAYLRMLGQPPVTADLAYWWNDRVEIVKDITEDEQRVELIAKAAKEFWESYVVPQIYPPPERWAQARVYYSQSDPESYIEASPDIIHSLITLVDMEEKLKEYREQARIAEASVDELKLLVGNYMGSNENLQSLGVVLATWTPNNKGSRTLRLKRNAIMEVAVNGSI